MGCTYCAKGEKHKKSECFYEQMKERANMKTQKLCSVAAKTSFTPVPSTHEHNLGLSKGNVLCECGLAIPYNLAAASPELLHACQVALDSLTSNKADGMPVAQILIDAIAKAEGRE